MPGRVSGPGSPDLGRYQAPPALYRAAEELAFLLSRGYPDQSARRFVGDHHQLPLELRRILAAALSLYPTAAARRLRFVPLEKIRGRDLILDGYNVLITAESVLLGRVLVLGADGALRDVASLSRSAGPVRREAMEALRDLLCEAGPASVTWYLDAPVSGSGELAAALRSLPHPGIAAWEAGTVANVDSVLVKLAGARPGSVVAGSDAVVLDRVEAWTDPAGELARRQGVEPIGLLEEKTPS